jgi:CheY-like chemotaxis protein
MRARHAEAGQPGSGECILVVENEDSNLRLMEQILDFAGYRFLPATNGLEALTVLDQEQVDLVLIDLAMPILDGYRTTELMRLRPEMATTPIVAVTAHAMSEDRELALASGCTDYIAKPFRPHQLLNLIERLLVHE